MWDECLFLFLHFLRCISFGHCLPWPCGCTFILRLRSFLGCTSQLHGDHSDQPPTSQSTDRCSCPSTLPSWMPLFGDIPSSISAFIPLLGWKVVNVLMGAVSRFKRLLNGWWWWYLVDGGLFGEVKKESKNFFNKIFIIKEDMPIV